MQIRVVVLAQANSNRSVKLLAALSSKTGLQAAGKDGIHSRSQAALFAAEGFGVHVMASSLHRSYPIATLGSYAGSCEVLGLILILTENKAFFSGMLVCQSLAYKRDTGYSQNGHSFFSSFLLLLLLSLWRQVSFTFKIEFELPIRYEVNWFKIRMKNNVIFVLKMDCWPDAQSQNIAASGSCLGLVTMTPHSWSFVSFLARFFQFLCAGFCWISKFWMGCISASSLTLFSFWAVSH